MSVIHFAGHMFLTDPALEATLGAEVSQVLAAHGVSVGYGALACGADIVIAEALLARGGELHVVLPVAVEAFLALSVSRGGAAWVPRFHRCLTQAASLTVIEPAARPNVARIAEGSRQAMVLALARDTRARQLAVWDGRPGRGPAGTGADVARWRAMGGGETLVIPLPAAARRPE